MIFDKFRLDNRVAIVTGSASGLGKEMARGLAEAGAHIVVADINLEAAARFAEELMGQGVNALAVQVDVTDEEQIDRMVEKVMAQYGQIDVLINNAGIGARIEIEHMSYQDWQRVMDVNMNSVFLVSKAVGKVMIGQRRGSIINISSISGIIANVPQKHTAYNASKAGVIMITKSMALEWAEYNIRINTIAPGYMKTEMTASDFNENKDSHMVKTWLQMTPMHRPGTPDELQGIALFLASDASSYATGGVFTMDGGYTIL
ncbi:SDR family NAD(P)-dependent oxidoreductase [Paenibacillus piri]|uniref:Glucose 1-dehydrogenase n=1 Tax=Paenibacillus piri TaxID=2547395 RepID=A0A4R5KSK9_9BACL|nr:glucose 1-dehydrogenase [Paenibacillus piri]TDF98853.1 glucose 1-dehydrogenase [Paenibacillus piri]